MGNLGIREKGGIGEGFSIESEVEGGDGLRTRKERGFEVTKGNRGRIGELVRNLEAVANSNVESGGGSAFCDFHSLILIGIRSGN
ncbi:hypothetical protein V6N13_031221 [Hibiscus sabdariffa]|uniref:Uncharacterized protein n=1 Tax=Hibiscus sabdariffa TaxID=183260 RepID=A0ABR2CL06_9ROSI